MNYISVAASIVLWGNYASRLTAQAPFSSAGIPSSGEEPGDASIDLTLHNNTRSEVKAQHGTVTLAGAHGRRSEIQELSGTFCTFGELP